ncbi:hypothetical protein VNO80_10378 [Phaseolus coccineus]|uniref:Uncharacterized protein n=1 Tax=Phaseolus coccineus TaxID=3886 RepID=A0AAN9ND97_PHACN
MAFISLKCVWKHSFYVLNFWKEYKFPYVYVIDRGSLVGFLELFVHFKGDILNKIRLWFLIASLSFSCLDHRIKR